MSKSKKKIKTMDELVKGFKSFVADKETNNITKEQFETVIKKAATPKKQHDSK